MQTPQPQLDQSVAPRPSREDAHRLARARTLARRRRIRRIRTRAVGLTLALFIAAWVTIFAQLASGNDPALETARRTAKPAAVTASSDGAAGSRVAAANQAAGRVTSTAAAPSAADSASTASQSSSSDSSATSSQASSDQSTGSTHSAAASPAPVTTSQS